MHRHDPDRVIVTFQPSDTSVTTTSGATIRDVAAQVGVIIPAPCGGRGNCGKCWVRVADGVDDATETERLILGTEQISAGYRLACQARITSNCCVQVPLTAFTEQFQILTASDVQHMQQADSPLSLLTLELPRPSLADDVSDWVRITRAGGPANADIELLRALPQLLRKGNYAGTAVVRDGELVDWLLDPSPRCMAVCVDIGTTTLAASLVDVMTGEEVATSARVNPQCAVADDVLSRIAAASASQERLELLHRHVIQAINGLIEDLCVRAQVSPDSVYEVVLAGNTTMQHLALGINPRGIGSAPFTPVVSEATVVAAQRLGLRAHPRAGCFVFPVVSGYVGGDIVAGMLATRFAELDGPALFIDIGTNGEMVVNAQGRVSSASCAAGPAFEGAGIAHGMRAAAGAIESVRFNDDVAVSTIGGVPPLGICGSGLIDIVAELLRAGIIDAAGHFVAPENLSEVPAAIRNRVRERDGLFEFVVSENVEGLRGGDIVIGQRDVRHLQLAVAAVRAGVDTLLRRCALDAGDLKALLVAGAFGNYIRCENAQRIGLLPPEVPLERIAFVGNSSLAGARLAACSVRARETAMLLARATEHVELSTDADFQDTFISALQFPAAE